MKTFSVEYLFGEGLNQTISENEAKESPIKRATYEYFMNILEGFEEDIIAFDIVFPSPETGEYNFISFFKEDKTFIREVQDFAKSDFYRTKILSLSSILIEKALYRKCGLKLKEEYKNLVVIKRKKDKSISTFKVQDSFLFPFEFQFKRYQSDEEIEEEIKRKVSKLSENGSEQRLLKSLAQTVINSIVGNLEEVSCENPEENILGKFMRYLVWINMVADWKMYVYISVDISQEYNFGLVLLLKDYYENIHEKAKEIINKLRKQFVKDFAEYFLKKLRKKAIINAMATIMSRNMSHNIGSHILFYINSDTLQPINNNAEIRKFIKYLQQRMDFIAYISTGEWLPVGSIHFLVEDIISGFLNQKLLLNYIGFSEGVELENLVIDVYLNDEKVLSLENGQISKHSENDIKVFIPLGIVGFQALYSIFENIIRNSAKYGFATKEGLGKLRVTIKIQDIQGNIYLKIMDNVSEIDRGKVEEIKGEILKPILSETGEIDLKNWGLKEIKICATFLNSPNQGVEILKERIDESESPVRVELENNKYLAYVIKLIKGEEVYDDRNVKYIQL